jgi:hypothetical protein
MDGGYIEVGAKGSLLTAEHGGRAMSIFTTSDGTELYYKDWGQGQPVLFSHGWPLSRTQVGYRVRSEKVPCADPVERSYEVSMRPQSTQR